MYSLTFHILLNIHDSTTMKELARKQYLVVLMGIQQHTPNKTSVLIALRRITCGSRVIMVNLRETFLLVCAKASVTAMQNAQKDSSGT